MTWKEQMVKQSMQLRTCTPCAEGDHLNCRIPGQKALCRCKYLENHKGSPLAEDLLAKIERFVDAKVDDAIEARAGGCRIEVEVEEARIALQKALERL